MNISRHHATVEFEEAECCALWIAGNNQAHQAYIRQFLDRVAATSPRFRPSILIDVFDKTNHLIFIPSETHCNLYSRLATMERTFLTDLEKETILDCGHTTQMHMGALAAVRVKMTYPHQNN